jgi:hypothetical protein
MAGQNYEEFGYVAEKEGKSFKKLREGGLLSGEYCYFCSRKPKNIGL